VGCIETNIGIQTVNKRLKKGYIMALSLSSDHDNPISRYTSDSSPWPSRRQSCSVSKSHRKRNTFNGRSKTTC